MSGLLYIDIHRTEDMMPYDRSPLYEPIVPPPHRGIKRWELLAFAAIMILLALVVVMTP